MLVKRIANTSESLAGYCRGARLSFERDSTLGLLPKIERPEIAYALLERFSGEYMGAERKGCKSQIDQSGGPPVCQLDLVIRHRDLGPIGPREQRPRRVEAITLHPSP